MLGLGQFRQPFLGAHGIIAQFGHAANVSGGHVSNVGNGHKNFFATGEHHHSDFVVRSTGRRCRFQLFENLIVKGIHLVRSVEPNPADATFLSKQNIFEIQDYRGPFYSIN